jgi:hypothetical protein
VAISVLGRICGSDGRGSRFAVPLPIFIHEAASKAMDHRRRCGGNSRTLARWEFECEMRMVAHSLLKRTDEISEQWVGLGSETDSKQSGVAKD